MYPDIASGTRRFFAFLIDSILLFTIYIGVLIFAGTSHLHQNTHIYDYGFLALWMLYFTRLQSSHTKTLGMKLFGIILLDTNGEQVPFARLFWRNLLVAFTTFFFEFIPQNADLTQIPSTGFDIVAGVTLYTLINVIMVVASEYKQSLYDRLSGTYLYRDFG